MSPVAGPALARNAITFDVEEWFHADNLRVSRQRWRELPSRLDEPLDKILSLLEQNATRATFFVLGWIAMRSPEIVRRIRAAGHEIASHGFWHQPVTRQTRRAFAKDVRISKQILEDIVGKPIIGYRAPSYSINHDTKWALEVLEELGFAYDSSIYPARAPHGRYGAPGTSVRPYRIRPTLWEFPLPTLQLPRFRVPVATGAYLRLWPLAVTEQAVRQNLRRAIPVVINIHPWELDPDHPRWPAPWWRRALHYTNLHTTARKLGRLLSSYRFIPLRDLLVQVRFDSEFHDDFVVDGNASLADLGNLRLGLAGFVDNASVDLDHAESESLVEADGP
jgi:polysaccharide deacetylase family protein (PEP-CTERM system associated)